MHIPTPLPMQRLFYREYASCVSSKLFSTPKPPTSAPHKHFRPTLAFSASITPRPRPSTFRYVPRYDPGQISKFRRFLRTREYKLLWQEYNMIKLHHQVEFLTPEDYSALLHSLRPRRYLKFSPTRPKSNEKRDLLFRNLLETKQALASHVERLSVNDYAHILACARAGSFNDYALQIWQELIASGVKPDVYCYNSVIAILYGIDSLEFRTRATSGQQDIAAATNLLRVMIKNKVNPNSATFDTLILARAKKGDTEGIHDILKEIFGLSLHPDEEGSHIVQPLLPRHHPQAPTPHTLMALAVAYGFNGMISAALSSVELISRHYRIKCPFEVWAALLRWAALRSTRVAWTSYRQRVVPSTARTIWDLMRSSKVNVDPSWSMYLIIIQDELRGMRTAAAERLLIEFTEKFKEDHGTFTIAESTLLNIIKIHEASARTQEAARVNNILEVMKTRRDTQKKYWWVIPQASEVEST
ncbi:Pentatricopeptide repeat-containing protein 6, mitochondrial [Neolecta irregularis DAH-3]|uniref:Pentatricopeptide repeat-containing protein 6, mitochondrial n=1 Tax=Neolecta irregularis (strain DAH-3) TaxID=1198029 RepID=A0A1U7LTM4_NEOID|nr:Pentatricopeptide repeat-containing protein 6, mitochondrial [Neolecta irregularis DAH-3]|eukprot:OLL25994.1 Pentatricopeptide repeat-containing protein 6, mitochondrial [Neolecta irregularis DAH-3]